MQFPRPDDMALAPVWANYIVSQACAAALRLIPVTAAGVGVSVNREQVTLHFRIAALDDATEADMADIADELRMLLGDEVSVGVSYETTDDFRIGPFDGVHWFFAERVDKRA